jgi:hypothetical protein
MEGRERPTRAEALTAQLGATSEEASASAPTPTEEGSRAVVTHLDRFAPKTRLILASASEQAHQLGHHEIRPDHLLLALLLEPGTEVVRPLRATLGGDFLGGSGNGRPGMVTLREALLGRLKTSDQDSLPGAAEPSVLSEGSKAVFRTALAEADRLNSTHVVPAHLLLGLVVEDSAFDGTDTISRLAARGLRMAIGARAWRPALISVDPARAGQAYQAVPISPGGEPSAPRSHVITFRVTDAELAAIDALVDAGAMRTRSEASAWLVQSGIAANNEFFDQIRQIGDEITRLRQEVQRLAEARIGPRSAAPVGPAETSPTQPPAEAQSMA